MLDFYKNKYSISSEDGLLQLKTSITTFFKDFLEALEVFDWTRSSQAQEGSDYATLDSLLSDAEDQLEKMYESLREAGPGTDQQFSQPQQDGLDSSSLPSVAVVKNQPPQQHQLQPQPLPNNIWQLFWNQIKEALSKAPPSKRHETLMTTLRSHHQIAADDNHANECLKEAYGPCIPQLIPGGDVVPWGLFLRLKARKAWHEELLANLCKCSGDFLRR